MSMQGYSGSNYDKFVERKETSTLHKFKETFWTTKQAVIQKLGKKEDAHVVASDAELDAKLEVFKAIQQSCMELLRAIEKYQDRLCSLAQEENATGRFLKSHSGQDKTRAGKMMAAVGKSQSFAAQQRLSLRVPLVRLYQEVETFRYRAISDTLMTINRMEGARTEYRGALLWMKDVSEQLDPDTYKQLEKFRKVQAQVKKTKGKFDKLKLDVMQKVDLLAASRCNMFSHVLANYQSSLLHFWEKTSRTMTAVAEGFKGYQYYEFSIIKELQEPAKRLSDSSRQPAERDIGDDFDPEKGDGFTSDASSSVESIEDNYEYDDKVYRLLSLDDDSGENKEAEDDNTSLQNLMTDPSQLRLGRASKEARTKGGDQIFDFGEEVRELAGQYDFMENLDKLDTKLPLPKNTQKDLLSDDIEGDDTEKDDMTILNEILNAPSTAGEDDFSREWQAVFGHTSLTAGTTLTPGEPDQSQNSADFMPSHLLDMSQQMEAMNLNAAGDGMMVPQSTAQQSTTEAESQPKDLGAKPKQSKKGQKTDMSAWFSLFADLDPLADPDSIGKQLQDGEDICKG